jgi:hypothetical protein
MLGFAALTIERPPSPLLNSRHVFVPAMRSCVPLSCVPP